MWYNWQIKSWDIWFVWFESLNSSRKNLEKVNKIISKQISNLRKNFSTRQSSGVGDREWGDIVPFFPSFLSPSCLKEMWFALSQLREIRRGRRRKGRINAGKQRNISYLTLFKIPWRSAEWCYSCRWGKEKRGLICELFSWQIHS